MLRSLVVLLALSVSSSSGLQQRLVLEKAEITVGRVQGNDVILPHASVSRRHARIVVRHGKIILVDLRSTNGTFVNGRRLASPLVVNEHDEIAIGEFRISVEEEDAPTLEWFPAPPLDPVEAQLIAAMRDGDRAARAVYADWLEERGEHARAELLRLWDHLLGLPPDDPGHGAARAQLGELARGVSADWRDDVGWPGDLDELDLR
jgi:pilus assembly protein CpaF